MMPLMVPAFVLSPNIPVMRTANTRAVEVAASMGGSRDGPYSPGIRISHQWRGSPTRPVTTRDKIQKLIKQIEL